ncbi:MULTISPECIES: hypothetical protein [unclassified Exiguobacterium]|uniref:hypothetical protein n=1 Tax=unclassified Exiguobacterium TaxID=2644629 RepID=UPI001BECC69B|nr:MULTISPECIES: hypothetical protein [unclassified Exiguobacterium]
MNLLKLLSWEVERVTKPFLILVTGLIVVQFGYLGYFLWDETNLFERLRREGNADYQYTFLDYLGSTPYLLSLGIAVAAMLLCSAWIWYRDFQGRGTFMLRLLTMPQKRMTLFFAKLATILMMTLGLFAIEWIALKLQYIAFTSWFDEKMIPMRGSFEQAISYHGMLTAMYPSSLVNFVIHQLLIIIVVLFIFTFVLIERSFWQRTMWSPVLSLSILVVILTIPILGYAFLSNRLIYDETIVYVGVVLVVWTSVTIWLGRRFLQTKLNV